MTYKEIDTLSAPYRNALLVERVISGWRLHRIERVFRIGVILFCILWVASFLVINIPIFSSLAPSLAGIAGVMYGGIHGAFLLFFGSWLLFLLLYAFYASSYFKDVDPILPEAGLATRPQILFEIASVVSQGFDDPTVDFFASRFGGDVALRLGIESKEVVAFLSARELKKVPLALTLVAGTPLGLEAFAVALFRADESLRKFLATKAIDESDFVGASAWVSRIEETQKGYQRSWSRDSLGKTPGIGKDWAYGETALLERFAMELTPQSPSASLGGGAFGKHEAEEIERVLSRGREANVMLAGEAGVPKLAPLARLAKRISAGTVLPPLEHKRIFVFDGTLFVSSMKEKNAFETQLLHLLAEAAKAGNIIFVFDNFDVFVQGAKGLGTNVLTLIDSFLTSSAIQIVAISEIGAYHQLFEPDTNVRERFERVLIEGAGVAGSLPIIGDEALHSEYADGVLFTFQALRAIAESADRYFFEGIMPDKAIDLLKEVVQKTRTERKRVITREEVLELVSAKTGISTGIAKGDERTKLLKLEETLHERIVGQDEAVKSISGALRRARSGIGNPNKPVGSFLFLGPTGVGKTETTKALAQVFFGDEKAITRFDMSEYQTEDALRRLIGSFEDGKQGVLAKLLREKPYGVLLLDEFEKTNKDIHDLFLQILDEGFFTDAMGKKVNARNLMIIATSNAASDMIWKQTPPFSSPPRLPTRLPIGGQVGGQAFQGGVGGGSLSTPPQSTTISQSSPSKGEEVGSLSKDVVITEIINRAIFKPELLNRFDGVILFRPLSAESLRVIAKFQLQKLEKRLEEKGLELVINDTLLDYLTSVGQDPKFGARPMNRAIQEKVEQVIAEKMLRGEIGAGSKVELTENDMR